MWDYLEKLREAKLKRLAKEKKWGKLYKYARKHTLSFGLLNLDDIIVDMIDEKNYKYLFDFNLLKEFLDTKEEEVRITYLDKIIIKMSSSDITKHFVSDKFFFFAYFKHNKINDDIEIAIKNTLTLWLSKIYDGAYSLNDDVFTPEFHKYIKLIHGENYYNNFGYILDTKILKEFFTIEDFNKISIPRWNDIVLDFAEEENDYLKYIKKFKKFNIDKLIEKLDVIDCTDIENYNLIREFSQCHSSESTAKFLKKSNLSIEEQKEIIRSIPTSCSCSGDDYPRFWNNKLQ